MPTVEKRPPFAVRIAPGFPGEDTIAARAETPEQAKARADLANADAERLGAKARYAADTEPS